MLRWTGRNAIDRARWDTCIRQCAWGKVYALFDYLDHVCAGQWEALILGDYEWVMPVPYRVKYGIPYVYRPDFCQQLGLFGPGDCPDPELANSFIEALKSRYAHIHYPLNHTHPVTPGSSLQVRTNLVLSLEPSYEIISAHYGSDLKSNLKKAEKAGAVINRTVDPGEVLRVYKEAWQHLYPISEETYRSYETLIRGYLEQGMAVSLGVEVDSTLVAACFIVLYKNRIYYPFSGLTPAGRKIGATAFLIDGIIRQYAGTQNVLDFEGSDLEKVRYFYSKFNPYTEPYYQLDQGITAGRALKGLLKRRFI